MKITRSFCIAMVCFFFVSGCATIINGSKNPIAINSNLDGAEISIINKKGEVIHKGTTPATVTLKSGAGYFKGEDYKVIFKKEGYAPQGSSDSAENQWLVHRRQFPFWRSDRLAHCRSHYRRHVDSIRFEYGFEAPVISYDKRRCSYHQTG